MAFNIQSTSSAYTVVSIPVGAIDGYCRSQWFRALVLVSIPVGAINGAPKRTRTDRVIKFQYP